VRYRNIWSFTSLIDIDDYGQKVLLLSSAKFLISTYWLCSIGMWTICTHTHACMYTHTLPPTFWCTHTHACMYTHTLPPTFWV